MCIPDFEPIKIFESPALLFPESTPTNVLSSPLLGSPAPTPNIVLLSPVEPVKLPLGPKITFEFPVVLPCPCFIPRKIL